MQHSCHLSHQGMFENSRFQRWQRRREALNFAHLACVIPTHLHLLVVWWWAGQLTFLWNGYVVCCLTHREALSWSIFSGERSLKTLRAAQMCRMLISVLRCKDRAMFFFPHRVALCFEEWWSQTVSGDNPLTQTHSTWLVPLTKEERNWVTMFINRPLSSALLGARPWFILKEKQIVQKLQTLPWKNPSSVWVQISSFQEKSIQISQPRSCLSRLLGSLLGVFSGSSEASWGEVGLPGRASVFLSFLVMQSLVRQGNKKLIFWRGRSHLWGIIFYEPKTLKCCRFILIADTMSKCPSCLFVLLASMDEKWNGADPVRAG